MRLISEAEAVADCATSIRSQSLRVAPFQLSSAQEACQESQAEIRASTARQSLLMAAVHRVEERLHWAAMDLRSVARATREAMAESLWARAVLTPLAAEARQATRARAALEEIRAEAAFLLTRLRGVGAVEAVVAVLPILPIPAAAQALEAEALARMDFQTMAQQVLQPRGPA